jgi:rhodanese-related sulfurtransferase
MADELIQADSKSVNTWHSDAEVVLVDVRETNEYEYEHIPGSLLLPLSFLDGDLFPQIDGKKVLSLRARVSRIWITRSDPELAL